MKLFFIVNLILFSLSSFSKPHRLNLEKFRSKLNQDSSQVKVLYRNHLGEGKGKFDSLPRYNKKEVNCTTWWQQLLAESYADRNNEILTVLDHIRYFGGVISFGTRKHFLDHFLSREPGPLLDVDHRKGDFCNDDQTHKVYLNTKLFKKHKKYKCPMAFEKDTKIVFTFLTPRKAINCVDGLSDGIYLAFPVATTKYLSIWGKKSGPMGLVHGLVVNKEEGKAIVYHASIDRGKVAHEPFSKYVKAPGSALFKGYKIYELKEYYDPVKDKKFSNKDFQEILTCEASLQKSNI